MPFSIQIGENKGFGLNRLKVIEEVHRHASDWARTKVWVGQDSWGGKPSIHISDDAFDIAITGQTVLQIFEELNRVLCEQAGGVR